MTTSFPTRIIVIAVLLVATNACLRKSTIQTQTQTEQVAPGPTASPQTFPSRIGLVNDFADVFDPAQEMNLNTLLTEVQRDRGVEFVVVTIDSSSGQSLFDYSLALARDWKPGGESGRGLVLVLAIKDRGWRLQVTKSLEEALPDDVCKTLGEPSMEFYRQQKYAEGVERYIRAIADHLPKQAKPNQNSSRLQINLRRSISKAA